MAIVYQPPRYDAYGDPIPRAVVAEAIDRADRLRWGSIILAELWDAVNGDLQAIETLFHAAYAMRQQDDATSNGGTRNGLNVNERVQLPSRYTVATEALQPSVPARPLLSNDPPDAGNPEANILRDALRYLTR